MTGVPLLVGFLAMTGHAAAVETYITRSWVTCARTLEGCVDIAERGSREDRRSSLRTRRLALRLHLDPHPHAVARASAACSSVGATNRRTIGGWVVTPPRLPTCRRSTPTISSEPDGHRVAVRHADGSLADGEGLAQAGPSSVTMLR